VSEKSKKRDPQEAPKVIAMPGAFALTDMGNSERLTAHWRGQFRYSHQRRKFLVRSRTRWDWDETGHILRMAKSTVRQIFAEAAACSNDDQRAAIGRHAFRSEGTARIEAMVKLAQSEEGIPVLISELDADPWLLNADNGTIDLKTGGLLPHRAADLITKSTGIPFNPGATSELWQRVLHDATGGNLELAAYLQRAFGYALIGDPLERAFFFLHGPPGTAKSTIVEALHAALGDYAHSAAFDTWLVQANIGGNRGDLVRLIGARLVTSVEVRQGARWDEALVKRVTGGDEVVAAAKFEAEVSFRPGFTLLLAANDAPSAREDDAGLWARMRRIPLTAQIPTEKQDPTIKAKLRSPEHAAAVLAWAVAGCLAYQRDGLGTCKAVEASTAEYRAENDHFSEFLSDCCVFESRVSATRKALRDKYEAWAKETGVRKLLSARDIGTRLRARGAEEKIVRGNREWVGMRFRDEHDGDQIGVQGAVQNAVSPEVPTIETPRGSLENTAPNCTLPAPQVQESFGYDEEQGEPW
jgi:putative DNA primase/helicase